MTMRRPRIGTASANHSQAVAARSLLVAASIAVLLLLPKPVHGEFESVIRDLFPWYYEDRITPSRPNLAIQAGKSDGDSSDSSGEAIIVEPCWGAEEAADIYETCPDAITSLPIPKGTCDFDNTRWRTRYDINLETVHKAGCQADVIWYGDSIIQYWDSKGPDIWNDYMDGVHSIPSGLSGDKTGDLLCRIQQGEFSRKVYPKVVIISIGINDVIFADDKDLETDEGVEQLASQAAENVRGIIGFIKQLACEVTVVITSVLTTVEESDVFTWPNRATPAIYAINREYKKIAEQERKVHFVDCHDLFVESKVATDGDSSEGANSSSDSKPVPRIVSQINQELMKDGIHPSRDGYKALAQCVITDFVKPIAIKDIEFSPPSEYEKYMPFPPPSHPPESPPQPSMPPSPPLSLPSPPLPSPPLPPSEPAQPTPTPAAPMPTKRAIRRRPQNKRRRPKGDIDSRQTPRPVPATSENTEAQTEAMKRTASTNEDTLRSPDIVVIDSPPLRISQETVVPSFIQDAVPAAKQRAFVSQNLDTAARVAEQPARARSAPSSSESPPKGGTRGTLMIIAVAGLAMLLSLLAVIAGFAVTFKRKHASGISKRAASLADIRTDLGDFHPWHKAVESTVAKMGPNKLSHAKHRRCASDGPWNLETYGDNVRYAPVPSRRDRGVRHRSFDAADLSYDDSHGNGASVDNSTSGWDGALPQRQLSSVLSLSGDNSLIWGSLGGSLQASAIMAAYNDPHASISEDDGSLSSNEARLEQDAPTDNSAAAAPVCQAAEPQPDKNTPTPHDSPADHHGKSQSLCAAPVAPGQQPPQATEQSSMGHFFKRIFFWGSPSTGGGQRRKHGSPLPVTMHPSDNIPSRSTTAGQPPNAAGPSIAAEAVAEMASFALMGTRHREDDFGSGSGSLHHYLDTEEGGISGEVSISMPPHSAPEDSTSELP